MIKCIGFGKLLKQLFIISLISCFGLLGSSFVNAGRTFWNVGEEYTPSSQSVYTQNIRPSGAGILYGGGLSSAGVPLIMVPKYYSTYNSNLWVLYYYDSNSDLRYVARSNGNPSTTTTFYGGKFSKFFLVNPNTFFDCASNNVNSFTSCGGVETDLSIYKSRADLKGGVSRIAYYVRDSGTSTSQGTMCLIFDTVSVGMCFFPTNNYADTTLENGSTYNPIEFNTSLIGVSPRVSNTNISTGNNQVGDGGDLEGINYVGLTGEDLVNYFENNPLYKFNKNVCYVGTNDYSTLLSSVYNSGFSLNIGTGGDIFDLYLAKYGNDFTIKQLGSFINARRSNYGTIFLTNEEDRLYWLEYYDGFVHQFYTDLTINKFLTSPYVFYNLGQITYNFSSQSSVGEEIATYCYYKLGYNNYTGGLNIIDNHDSSYDENALNYKENYLRNSYRFTGGVIVSESWVGTPLDYLDGTGEENLDFSTFFNKSFNRFKSVFDLDTSTLPIGGFLPTYIIMFLLAIIFFRFISH